MQDLGQLLRFYSADCQPTAIEPLGSAGGMSGAQFWRVRCPRGTLVLRRWPTEHPTSDRLKFIDAVLNHAAANGIGFIPIPIATRAGTTFVDHAGHLWELAPWLPGIADYEQSPSDEKLRAAMTALARFHNAVADYSAPSESAAVQRAAGSSAIPRRLARLRELSRGESAQLQAAIRDTPWPEFAALARQFMAALPNAIPRAVAALEPLGHEALPLQPCLRDIWHDHVLFTGSEVTGIVDFGAVDLDTPATDLARLLGSLPQSSPLPFREGLGEGSIPHDTWQAGLAAYSAIRPLSTQERHAITALNTANPILAGCNWIRWIYIDHRQFENPAQILTRFQRLLSHLGA